MRSKRSSTLAFPIAMALMGLVAGTSRPSAAQSAATPAPAPEPKWKQKLREAAAARDAKLAAIAAAKNPPKPAPAPPPPAPPPPPPALADTLTGMAKAEYEAGKILYQDGDYQNALLKFQHSYDLAGEPRLLWNIAACEKNLRHYTRVLAAVEKYEKEALPLLTEQDKQDATDLVNTVRTLVSTLTVTSNEDGADVFVDDEKIGTTPLPAPVLINVGNRKVRVVKLGYKEFAETEAVAGATAVTVAATLEKEIHEGRLIVEARTKDAITIDGKTVATGRWNGVLPSGGHSLRVTSQGYIAYQSEIVIQDNQTRRLPVTLEATKGGVPTAWLLGGAGVVVTVGAAIAVALLVRPAAQDPTKGTVGNGYVTLSTGGGFHFGGGR